MKKEIIILATIIVITGLVIKSIPNEKKRLANDIKLLKKAVEKEDKIGTLLYLDSAYKDKRGVNYENLTATIDDFFKDFDAIKISMNNIKIKIDSITSAKTTFATCSLGLKVFAQYGTDKVIVFGSVIHPTSVRAYFKKNTFRYKLYSAEY